MVMDFLRGVHIFVDVDHEQLLLLSDKLLRRSFRRGEVIFHQYEPGDQMYIVKEGQVKISIMSSGGLEKDIALLHPGECFGEMALLDGSNRSATATAVNSTQTLALYREDFMDFLNEHPEVAYEINGLLVKRLRIANEMVGDVVFLDVPTRVAKQLLALAETYSRDLSEAGHVVVPMGQEELARLVGASRETVSRALASYRRMGVLTTANRRITITDLPRLKGMSDF